MKTKTEKKNEDDNRVSLWNRGYGIYEEPEAPSLEETWVRWDQLLAKCKRMEDETSKT